MRFSVIVGLLTFLPSSGAQTSAKPAPIPSSEVDFKASPDGGALSSCCLVHGQPVADLLFSGFVFTEWVPDPENRSRELAVRFDISWKTRAIDPGAIEGLSYVQMISAGALPGRLAVLVHAATSGSGAGERVVPKPGDGTRQVEAAIVDGFFVCF